MENYPYIPFVPDRTIVLRRMRSQKASFPPELEDEINGYIREAQNAFTVRGRALVCDLKSGGEDAVTISGERIESRMLAKLLGASSKAYLMCAAMPRYSVDMINTVMMDGRGLEAFVLDAYASEYVDGALDIIIQRKNEALRRTGQTLTHRRFSPGYGDLDIKYQKVFYDLLKMGEIGVEITDRFLLNPEKSVIAIAGVE